MTRPIAALLLACALAAAPAVAADAPAPRPAPATDAAGAIDLAAYAGRVVVLDFWASWCGPCRASLPWLQLMQDRYREQGLAVLTVNVDRDRAAAEEFLRKLDLSLPVAWDPEGKLAAAYKLEAMPSSFVYGRDGRLSARHVGFDPRKSAEAEAELVGLLQEAKPHE